MQFMFTLFAPFKKEKFKIQSFTYFIPAPPHRQSGYREKHFDRLLTGFLSHGFEVIDIKTQSLSNANTAGMWVLCLVRPTNKKAEAMNWDNFQEQVARDTSSQARQKNAIDGFYYIHEGNPTENEDDDESFEYYDENKTYKK